MDRTELRQVRSPAFPPEARAWTATRRAKSQQVFSVEDGGSATVLNSTNSPKDLRFHGEKET